MSRVTPAVSVIVAPHPDVPSTVSCVEDVLQQRTEFAVEVVVVACGNATDLRTQLENLFASAPHTIQLVDCPDDPRQFPAQVLTACRGGCVTVRAPDEHWTSHEKLQQQVNSLDEHPDWVMCCHPVQLVGTEKSPSSRSPSSRLPAVLSLAHLLQSDNSLTSSAVMRRDVMDRLPEWLSNFSTDVTSAEITRGWVLLHATHGDVGCLSESLAEVRVTPSDAPDSSGPVRRWNGENLILRRLRSRLPAPHQQPVSQQLSSNHAQLAHEAALQIKTTAAFRHRRLSFLYGGWRAPLPLRTKLSQSLYPFSSLHRIAASCFEAAEVSRDAGRFLVFAARTMIRQPDWLRRLAGSAVRHGPAGLMREWRVLRYLFAISAEQYQRWIRLYDSLSDADRSAIRDRIRSMHHRPQFSIIMPVFNTPESILRRSLNSVLGQLYEDWELCVADDASDSLHVRQVLEEYQRADPRIRCCFREDRGNISAASNSALDLATGEFITFLDHDDELAEHALYMVAEELLRFPETDLIFSDEDRIDSDGRRESPYFKTDWNPDLMLSQNAVCHLAVYRRDLLLKVGGLRIGVEGSQDHDLVLRYTDQLSQERIRHIPAILYHWRRMPGSVSRDAVTGAAAFEAGVRAVQEHLDRRGTSATVTVVTDRGAPHYRVRYSLPAPAPPVSIVIPTRDRVDLLRRCVEGLLTGTDYPDMEVLIVDNDSTDRDTLAYLSELDQHRSVRVVRDTRPFNYSALNNLAVDAAAGDVVCLLNNDIEVIHADWLREMVSHAVQPGVGAVGARLLFPDDCVQHAGVMIGYGGGAGHEFSGLPVTAPVPSGRLDVVRNVSCVTAACMVFRKRVYQEHHGLDEELFAVAYNDVDFCLRLSEAGYRIVWTPFATLYHHESASRGRRRSEADQARDFQEGQALRERWQKRISSDPNMNPNVSIQHADYRPAFPPRVQRPW